MTDGNWHFHVHRYPSGTFCGLAKKEPFVNGDPIGEPGEVWFEFGDTFDEALANIKKYVLQ